MRNDFRSIPLYFFARVAELAYATDLKSVEFYSCGFKSHHEYHYIFSYGDFMKESVFQNQLISELKKRFEGCIVLKNDASYIQGIPDLLVLYNDIWFALECKKNDTAHKQPNQEYYVKKMNDMSYATFINPNNKEEILNDLEQTFKS